MAVRQMNRRGHPAILYLHPYEFDPENLEIERNEVREVGRARVRRTEIIQNLRRSTATTKLLSLLDTFRFGPLRDLLPERNVEGPAPE